MNNRTPQLMRLSTLSGLIRSIRDAQCQSARSRCIEIGDQLADPALLSPPDPADTAAAAQHARWARARRAALARALEEAQVDLSTRQTLARRAFGVDQAVGGLVEAERAAALQKARRG